MIFLSVTIEIETPECTEPLSWIWNIILQPTCT